MTLLARTPNSYRWNFTLALLLFQLALTNVLQSIDESSEGDGDAEQPDEACDRKRSCIES